jgi:ABC-type transporter Mla subunit MlaD
MTIADYSSLSEAYAELADQNAELRAEVERVNKANAALNDALDDNDRLFEEGTRTMERLVAQNQDLKEENEVLSALVKLADHIIKAHTSGAAA